MNTPTVMIYNKAGERVVVNVADLAFWKAEGWAEQNNKTAPKADPIPEPEPDPEEEILEDPAPKKKK